MSANYFEELRPSFSLLRAGEMPVRHAQLGALHGVASHFSKSSEPALVVMPTGVGKTAISQGVPFVLEGVHRVLVVVPSRVLRSDGAERFACLTELKQTSLIPDDARCPRVHELTGRPADWGFATDFDVVVATPQSCSPPMLEAAGLAVPATDLFDLIVVDEGHHVPAPTWRALVEHFDEARKVLLTATPYRRDRQDVVGAIAYDYSLELAVAEGAYSAVSLVPVAGAGRTPAERDRLIAERAVERLRSDEHSGSALLVRAATKERAEVLSALYEELGVRTSVVHSGLTARTVRRRLGQLRTGELEGIAFVGILGEGFDHPALKIGAYHDKHMSLPATLQFIGRLARASDGGAAAEVVTIVEDLEADTWQLYQHDAVWSDLIPGLADEATREVVERKALISRLPPPPTELALYDVEPKRKGVVYELPTAEWDEPFSTEALERLGLVEGAPFLTGRIYYAAADPENRLLLIISAHHEHPPWMRTRTFDSVTYRLHSAVAEPAAYSQGSEVTYLFVSSATRSGEARLAKLVAGGAQLRVADPDVINRCMEAFNFEKYHGVGLRAVGPKAAGRASYRISIGPTVNAAVQEADTRGHRLGHAMGTARGAPGKPRSGAGVSTVNARIFESSFTAISGYVEWVRDIAAIIRSEGSSSGRVPLIPSLRYEVRLDAWPTSPVIGTELAAEAYESELTFEGGPPLDRVALAASIEDDALALSVLYDGAVLWSGTQSISGEVASTSGDRRLLDGWADAGTLAEFLEAHPPTVFFADGAAVTGTRLTAPTVEVAEVDRRILRRLAWRRVTITRELRSTAHSPDLSVQDYCERLLLKLGGRFVVLDDASGELADYVAIAGDSRAVHVTFVHCKASTEPEPGLRLADVIEVLDQARRSARWIQQGADFWDELAKRLRTRASTRVISEAEHDLSALLELCERAAVAPPAMEGTIVIAQPGLAIDRLIAASGGSRQAAAGVGVVETVMHASSLIQTAAVRLQILGS